MRKYIFACLFSAVFGALLAICLTEERRDSHATAQDKRPAPKRPFLIDDTRGNERPSGIGISDAAVEQYTVDERINIGVYERANRSVVHITTRVVQPDMFFMFSETAEGEGSGSVLDKQGHILTNFHVIKDARAIRVTLYNGEEYDAGLIGQDPANDIAVLRIDAPPEHLHPMVLGDSSRLKVGQKVLAIGNPFGLDRTLTVGVVSSLNRAIRSTTGRQMKSIIQIDAALNRGNSGGPLLNSRAELVGMNTAIANPSNSGENTGVGFSIPVNTVRRVVPQLIEHGRVLRPVIGISSVFESDQGIVLIEVVPGGPADRAGLRGFEVVTRRNRQGPFVRIERYVDRENADLVTAIDGKPVRTRDEFLDIIEAKRPGDTVNVRVVRDNREVDIPVTLGAPD